MFRDKEIIGLINQLLYRVNKNLETFETFYNVLNRKYDAITSLLEKIDTNTIQDDAQFRYQIKLAMKEFREQLADDTKKEKKVLKKK